MAEQIGSEQLARMSSWEIDQARAAGQLEELTAALNTPTSHVWPYTVPTDETGQPVVQLTAAEVEALSPEGMVTAMNRGQLAAYLSGDSSPTKPAPPARPEDAGTQPAGGAEL